MIRPYLSIPLAALIVVLLQTVAVAAPPSAARQVVEYYGDSTIWGYRSGTGGQVAITAPSAFSAALPAGRFEVRNEGVNGTTACELLDGADGKHLPWQNQMKESRANYVIVNFAINDQWKHDVPDYQACLRGLARTARQYGKEMIFETPNPTRDSGPTGLDIYVKAMKEVAAQEGIPVIDQYKYLTDFLNGQSPLAICPDGLHPSAPVYIMKGRHAARTFLTLLSQQQ